MLSRSFFLGLPAVSPRGRPELWGLGASSARPGLNPVCPPLPRPELKRKRSKVQRKALLLKKPLRADLVLENTSKVPAPKE